MTPKSSSMASSDRPLVSGTRNQTKKNMEKQKLPKMRYVLFFSQELSEVASCNHRDCGGLTHP